MEGLTDSIKDDLEEQNHRESRVEWQKATGCLDCEWFMKERLGKLGSCGYWCQVTFDGDVCQSRREATPGPKRYL